MSEEAKNTTPPAVTPPKATAADPLARVRELMLSRITSSETGEVDKGLEENKPAAQKALDDAAKAAAEGKPAPTTTPAATPPATTPPASTTTPPATPPATPPKDGEAPPTRKGRKPAARVEVDPSKVAAEAAAAATKAALEATAKADEERRTREAQAAAAKSAETPTNPELPAAFKKDQALYDRLAKDNPKYKTIHTEIADWDRKVQAARTKFERENPGKTFDLDDEQHAELLDAMPQIDKEDIDATREKIREEDIQRRIDEGVQQRLKPLEERLKGTESAKAIEAADREILPKVLDLNLKAVQEAVGEFDPEAGKLITSLDSAVLAAVAEKRPDIAKVVGEVGAVVLPLRREAARILSPVGQQVLDLTVVDGKQRNPLHHQFVDYYMGLERTMAARPPEERVMNGKSWVPVEQWGKLTPEQRANSWYFDGPIIDRILENEFRVSVRDRVKAQEDEIDRIARLRGYTKPATNPPGAGANPPVKTTTTSTPPPLPAGGNSPTVTPGSPALAPGQPPGGQTGDIAHRILDRIIAK